MLNSLLKRALGLERTVIEGARIEGDSIIVSVRPRRAAPRCPVCGRRCAAYDRLGPRRWRAPDLGAARCYLEHAPVRASCPEHGVRTAPVPWARCASSRFASAFEDWVAWLALHMCRSALAELARVDWHTVGASARASRRRWRRPTGAAGSTGFAGSASTRRATRRARGT